MRVLVAFLFMHFLSQTYDICLPLTIDIMKSKHSTESHLFISYSTFYRDHCEAWEVADQVMVVVSTCAADVAGDTAPVTCASYRLPLRQLPVTTHSSLEDDL